MPSRLAPVGTQRIGLKGEALLSSVSSAAIRLAAEQVARRSDAKHARLVPVDYTLKKYVRKPRGAAPGAVTYSREKTLDVSPDGE